METVQTLSDNLRSPTGTSTLGGLRAVSTLKETGGPGSFSSGESAVTPALLSRGVRGPYGVTVTEEALESGCQGFSPGLLAE